MYQVSGSLTAAQLSTLFSAPPVVLPPQGAGIRAVPIAFVWRLNYGTVPFTLGTTLSIVGGDSGQHLMDFINTGLLDTRNSVNTEFANNVPDYLDAGNNAITLTADADSVGGDSTVSYDLFYVVVGP